MNRFRTGQGQCGTRRKKWGLTDNEMCVCGDIQTMSHIVDPCPPTKLDGGAGVWRKNFHLPLTCWRNRNSAKRQLARRGLLFSVPIFRERENKQTASVSMKNYAVVINCFDLLICVVITGSQFCWSCDFRAAWLCLLLVITVRFEYKIRRWWWWQLYGVFFRTLCTHMYNSSNSRCGRYTSLIMQTGNSTKKTKKRKNVHILCVIDPRHASNNNMQVTSNVSRVSKIYSWT